MDRETISKWMGRVGILMATLWIVIALITPLEKVPVLGGIHRNLIWLVAAVIIFAGAKVIENAEIPVIDKLKGKTTSSTGKKTGPVIIDHFPVPEQRIEYLRVRSIYKDEKGEYHEDLVRADTGAGTSIRIGTNERARIVRNPDGGVFFGEAKLPLTGESNRWLMPYKAGTEASEYRLKVIDREDTVPRRFLSKLNNGNSDTLYLDGKKRIRRIGLEDQCWGYDYGGSLIYFKFYKKGREWNCEVLKDDGGINPEIIEVRVDEEKSGIPYKIELEAKIEGKKEIIELAGGDRVVSDGLEYDTKQKVVPESGFYPTMVATLFGAVECGKTQWINAVRSETVQKKVERLTGYSYEAPEEEKQSIGRTQMGTVTLNPVKISRAKDKEVVGLLYLVDLPGELTKSSMMSSDQDDGKANKERLFTISNVVQQSNTLVLFCDDRVLEGDQTVVGNLKNIWGYINSKDRKGLKYVYICSKGDKLKGKCAEIKDASGRTVLTGDSVVFKKVVDQIDAADGIEKRNMRYDHIAVATDVLASCNVIKNPEKDVGFIVSSGPEDGPGKLDHTEEINVELSLAYLIQKTMGLK